MAARLYAWLCPEADDLDWLDIDYVAFYRGRDLGVRWDS